MSEHYHIATQALACYDAGLTDDDSVSTSVRNYPTAAGAMNLGEIARYYVGSIERLCRTYSVEAVARARRPGAVLFRATSDRARDEDGEPDILVWPWACSADCCPRCTSWVGDGRHDHPEEA